MKSYSQGWSIYYDKQAILVIDFFVLKFSKQLACYSENQPFSQMCTFCSICVFFRVLFTYV